MRGRLQSRSEQCDNLACQVDHMATLRLKKLLEPCCRITTPLDSFPESNKFHNIAPNEQSSAASPDYFEANAGDLRVKATGRGLIQQSFWSKVLGHEVFWGLLYVASCSNVSLGLSNVVCLEYIACKCLRACILGSSPQRRRSSCTEAF